MNELLRTFDDNIHSENIRLMSMENPSRGGGTGSFSSHPPCPLYDAVIPNVRSWVAVGCREFYEMSVLASISRNNGRCCRSDAVTNSNGYKAFN